MRAIAVCLLLILAGCNLRPQGTGTPRYLVGEPYQINGVWQYPRENFTYNETGIATEAASTTVRFSANGESNDPTALLAGHRTLQLPAIARVTNLENGRQILVRINDRGPADPARVIALSARATTLLTPADRHAFRVRVQIVTDDSRRLANALINRPDAPPSPEAPRLQIAAAPTTGVASEALAPPSGVASRPNLTQAAAAAPAATADALPDIPFRLPEVVYGTRPNPGVLAIDCGSFGKLEYAEVLRRRIASLNPRVTTDYYAPRDNAYIVRLGPFPRLADAEAALRQALAAGVPDARIILE